MLDLVDTPSGLVDPIAKVVDAVLESPGDISPSDIMIVGARCRDILHAALGHRFATTATHDLDLGLALASWDAYRDLAASIPRVGNSGVRFRIAGVEVDLLPFGEVEDPDGVVEPPARDEPMSVWAFEEIYARSLPLTLSPSTVVRLPTVAGYAAAKLAAWLDRSAWNEVKDAADLALVLHWYAESGQIQDQLYETEEGNAILLAEGTDVPLAAARHLGVDIATVIGAQRQQELLARWPGEIELLVHELTLRQIAGWPRATDRRRALVDALTRGLRHEAG